MRRRDCIAGAGALAALATLSAQDVTAGSARAAGDAGSAPASAQTLTLPLGASARLAGTDWVVTFESVTADSRCPTGATCIWAGEARVRLKLRAGRSAAQTLELHLGPSVAPQAHAAAAAPPPDPTGSSALPALQLQQLTPHPVAHKPTRPAEYVATLRVSPAEVSPAPAAER